MEPTPTNHTAKDKSAHKQTEAPQDPLTDCPKCGGRGYVVIPGFLNNYSVPCPACNGEAA